MLLTPGKADETLVVRCPIAVPVPPGVGSGTYYNTNWENLHRNEQVERLSGSFYAISGWSIHNGNVLFADKKYNQTAHYANVTVVEMTEFNLYHAPEGGGIS